MGFEGKNTFFSQGEHYVTLTFLRLSKKNTLERSKKFGQVVVSSVRILMTSLKKRKKQGGL
jgi:hypothetical protein